MESQFKLAFLGKVPANPDAYGMMGRIGIRSYTVNANKILDIVQNLGPNGELDDKQFGITPEMHCEVMFGGRGFPRISRDEVVKMIKDVDIIIVSTTMSYFLSRALLMWLTPENLPKSCIIVLRLPFTEEDQSHKMHSVDILKIMGLKKNGESISKKGKKNDKKKAKTTHQIFAIGLPQLGGVEPEVGILQLRSALFSEEIIDELIKPVKETVAAGKSLLGWGKSFTAWMPSLAQSPS